MSGVSRKPTLQDAAALHQQFGLSVAGQALGLHVPGTVPGHDVTVPLQPGRIAQAGDPVLELAGAQREQPNRSDNSVITAEGEPPAATASAVA